VKLISALIRPEKVDPVKVELRALNIHTIGVVQVQDHTPQQHGTMIWRAHEYTVGSSLKMELHIAVDDEDVDGVIEVIMRVARTGSPGDGSVCVIPVDHRYDIASGRRQAS